MVLWLFWYNIYSQYCMIVYDFLNFIIFIDQS